MSDKHLKVPIDALFFTRLSGELCSRAGMAKTAGNAQAGAVLQGGYQMRSFRRSRTWVKSFTNPAIRARDMDRAKIRGNRNVYVQRHRRVVLQSVETLTCPTDGTVIYQGPKPTFAAVSCPKCKAVWPVNRKT